MSVMIADTAGRQRCGSVGGKTSLDQGHENTERQGRDAVEDGGEARSSGGAGDQVADDADDQRRRVSDGLLLAEVGEEQDGETADGSDERRAAQLREADVGVEPSRPFA